MVKTGIDLNIAGYIKYSTVDWPDMGCSVMFLQGCPYRCEYCHNHEILDINKKGSISFDSVVEHLELRKNLLDGVVFSGGEPTIQAALVPAIEYIKKMGIPIGIHTNGVNYKIFEKIVGLVDWVGFDIKAPASKYDLITKEKNSFQNVKKSLEILLKSGTDYQLRTTFDKTTLVDEDIETIKKELKEFGADLDKYVVQKIQTVNVTEEYKNKVKSLNKQKSE